jgi:lysophospholipase L1-like esterase
MKPLHSFIFLFVSLIVLAIIGEFHPKELEIAGIKLKFSNTQNIFSSAPEKKDIKEIVDNTSLIDDLETQEKLIYNDDNTVDTVRIIADSLFNVVEKLQFPNEDPSCMNVLFQKLISSTNQGKNLRILHYGDSQIEGDRITDYFRNKLQTKFGGSGPGMVPVVPANNISSTVIITYSDNWKRYTVFGKTDTLVKHKRYGSLAAFSRFAPVLPEKDSSLTNIETDNIYEAWVTLKKSTSSYSTNREFSKLMLFYGYNQSPVVAELYAGEELLGLKSLHSNKTLNVAVWDVTNETQELTIKFSGKDSPDIYGISLQNSTGIVADNIPMRGSAGLEFNKMDLKFLGEMYRLINVDMLILEFGLNLAPTEHESYDFYENWFSAQLSSLKRINPDMAIIVIGVSDMSRKTADYYETWPSIPLIRNAQRNAAFKNGCAFWDLYSAMGGENSMPSWVFADPPLAGKDFTHFNPNGARVIARMFYNAFIYEFNQYLKKKTSK